MKAASLIGLLLLSASFIHAQNTYRLASPDGKINVVIYAGATLTWSVKSESTQVLLPSAISMTLGNSEMLGKNVGVSSAKTSSVNNTITAVNYKKNVIKDEYNQLTLNCKGGYGVVFRAYNDGTAYRFFTTRKGTITITSEEAAFNFPADEMAFIPYVNDPHVHDNFQTSFENLYQHIPLSKMVKDTLAFAPVLIELSDNKKAVITEADLEDYAGMFLQAGNNANSLTGRFAPYPVERKANEQNPASELVVKRADYIAQTNGSRNFPWRVIVITSGDKELLNNDMVYRLATPSRLTDMSWIKPGKVAWDWWNDWNISHVDFRAGVNTETYKYYIDFASANHIEYLLMDAGWADPKDIMKVVPAVHLQEIIDYARQKNVGVWLWGGSYPLDQKLEEAFTTYAKMGIKGFKIDFMDRDDQKMVQFYYRVATTAAANHLMIDFHGAYKPTGLQRTYPNVLNFEGVRGMENAKWSNTDFPGYDVTIPYIRMLAGPMDYTPGAMKNANKQNFRPINDSPMSQGTRCHQLAMYAVFEAPLQMLSDNPTDYMKEQESTDFIDKFPTTYDETIALDGKVGAYVAIARRKGDTWYVGAMSDWSPRELNLDLSFLGSGNYQAEIFKDGINADRDATDYKREVINISSNDKIKIQLSNGGGWAAIITKVR